MDITEEVGKIREIERRGILFIIFFSTLVTFLIARSFVWFTHQEIHLVINGYIVHHAVMGILILLVVGFVSLVFRGGERVLAFFYGIGLGLVADEFGFLLSWGNYWNGLSYDFVVILILVLLNGIFFYEFWKEFGNKIVGFFRKLF